MVKRVLGLKATGNPGRQVVADMRVADFADLRARVGEVTGNDGKWLDNFRRFRRNFAKMPIAGVADSADFWIV
ncbi:MAG: hypothetical protein OJF49_003106 [Ktedonobacterales bacterium]|jgi:hypothetical protein|nr:MAG: hypothetical protein OJF49_003106 [Ktedonobacterales bacterium]